MPLPTGFSEGAGSPIVQFNALGQVFISFMAVTFKGQTVITEITPGMVTFSYNSNNGQPIQLDQTTTAAQVKGDLSAITGLRAVGAVTVSGNNGGPFTLSFGAGVVGPTLLSVANSDQSISTPAASIQPGEASALASGDFEDRGQAGTTSNNGIFAARGTEYGLNWGTPVVIVSHQCDGINPVFFEDLPQLAIDNSAASPNFGNLYEVWTRVYPAGQFPNSPTATGGTDIMIAVSKDDGQTWQTQYKNIPGLNTPVTALNDIENTAAVGGGTGNPIGVGFIDQPHVTVGADGSIYVAYVSGGPFAVAYSSPVSAGSTFTGPDYKSSERLAFGNNAGTSIYESGIGNPNDQNTDQFRTFNAKEILADPSHAGWVYAVSTMFVNDANGNTIDPADVVFARSTDYGVTWTPATVLNDDNGGQNATGLPTDVIDGQAQPRLAVDKQGNIGVIWYDTRRDPAGNDLDVFGTTSTDHGVTFRPNFRVSSQSFEPNLGAFKNALTQPGRPEVVVFNFATSTLVDASGQLDYYIGDFPGLAMANGTIYAAWTDTRNNGASSSGNQDVYFASYPVTPAPAAPPDRFAPNDTAALATNLGTHIQVVVPKLALPEGYEEWFQLGAAATGTLTISAASNGNLALASGTLQLQLFDDSGTNLLASGSDLDNTAGNFIGQSLAYPSKVGENFLVRVFRSNSVNTATALYQLSLQSLTADLGRQVIVDQAGTLGAGGEAVYKLTAAAAGSLQIQFTEGERSWELESGCRRSKHFRQLDS